MKNKTKLIHSKKIDTSGKAISKKKKQSNDFLKFARKILPYLAVIFVVLFIFYTIQYQFFGGYWIDGYNKEGYDKDGFNKTGFDKYGFDKNGYDWDGFDRKGYNATGYNRQGFNEEGYDVEGYDIHGFNKEGYDSKGYNKFGFNKEGFDRKGYDQEGYDKRGYDVFGFNRAGYDKEGYDKEGYNKLGYDREGYSRNPTAIEKVHKINAEYHKQHTYSSVDFFVCSDMSIDVWNLIETAGINARICAGNVEEDMRNRDINYFMANMDHVYVLAETEPFSYIAVETTGGYLVWGEGKGGFGEIENNLYYTNHFCFDNPKEFKKFLTLRDEYFEVCGEAVEMENYWNEHIAGTVMTYETAEYRGRMNAKIQECEDIINQLMGLLT